jgi:hypothetical protein
MAAPRAGWRTDVADKRYVDHYVPEDQPCQARGRHSGFTYRTAKHVDDRGPPDIQPAKSIVDTAA